MTDINEEERKEVFDRTFGSLGVIGASILTSFDEEKHGDVLEAYASNVILFGIELIIKLGMEPDDFDEMIDEFVEAVVHKINMEEAKQKGVH